ncbi:MAG: Fis family transcriptional regulator [Gammaproteobacteria bacterium]|jgi:Fis family transcriptional regulator, factor for inversion stimulation protein|nr:Fis family transcriptional regulator [Gammaproteobacteria bacterium]MBT5826573.1 Fis family transcriptional regulator [Gammaproteobacteria bacterium]MBT5966479.1 Fis family transcriptional regulator [Gammaproteobacteria bacterium]MBT6419718.1 Fis family transcriptional regulator [Gammaproteobacteria bacterium]MBT6574889.1 Fis family transcriptional regulator [Gammaproteobacteria bacterium]
MTIAKNTPITLSAQVKRAVEQYLAQLDGYQTTDLHALVLTEVEKPLFKATFQYAGYNQTKTAEILGISRSTLRKKLDQYGLS